MNEYAKHKLLQTHQSFVDRRFDQDDVALMIVLVRDYTPEDSIFRELGDLAHPDDKDRGLVLNTVRIAEASFEKDFQQYFHDYQTWQSDNSETGKRSFKVAVIARTHANLPHQRRRRITIDKRNRLRPAAINFDHRHLGQFVLAYLPRLGVFSSGSEAEPVKARRLLSCRPCDVHR
jgi:hypothetical protein